ncbi:radical SAM/SPASM domain-containing protein [Comamonas thiooxydans]|uniref:radical SAM/SPASM domain-containing protein n=1 Tax=Comamonas thiooxydans TaxID=363952 RepID=UPI001CCDF651|nr:SPASM domain-containing protein [Comamonas thiooxydans]UBQ44022.1 radical SAM protein [Comamonas thiooxydans]
MVVFSGGEVFLLKDDLFKAIKFSRNLGLNVRCITNGFWGKTEKIVKKTVERLVESGVSEINISTGADHQEHIPFESVERACEALVRNGISTLVTIEKDSPLTNCLDKARKSKIFTKLFEEHPNLFSIQCNSWMPFHDNYIERGEAPGLSSIRGGCTQIFNNIVITPYKKLAACCGLTYEHIPELTIGSLNDNSMKEILVNSLDDFLKIWIHLDGPATILRKLFGTEINDELREVRHICQACAVLHLHPTAKETLLNNYKNFVPDVIARFSLKVEMLNHEINIEKRKYLLYSDVTKL